MKLGQSPGLKRLQLHFDADASMRSELKDGAYRVTIRMPYLTAVA